MKVLSKPDDFLVRMGSDLGIAERAGTSLVAEDLPGQEVAPEVGIARPRKVSIIIDNYNYGRFVGDAVDSALAQTYPYTEVIVVDDGSTDNSRQVIESRGDRIRAIFKANGGHASAFNAGFEASTGDLVFFLDSDDMLELGAAETVVREWRDGVSRMIFPLKVINGRGDLLGRTLGGAGVPSPAFGPFGVGSPTSGNAFSRTVLVKIMPAPEVEWNSCADQYLSTASLFGETMCLKQPLGKYRVHRDIGHPQDDPRAVVRNRIHLDLKLYNAVFRLTDGKVGSLENWLGGCAQHWVRRIKSLRERPEDYPWPDSLPGLTVRAVKAAWRQPERNFRRRLAYSIFAIGYAILPRKATVVMWRAEGREHGRVFKRLLGA